MADLNMALAEAVKLNQHITHRKHVPPYMFKLTAELYKHYDEICQAINSIGVLNSGSDKVGKYLNRLRTPQQKEDFILKALAFYARHLERQRSSRDGR